MLHQETLSLNLSLFIIWTFQFWWIV